MLNNNLWKFTILILTIILYLGSSYIIANKNREIKDKLNDVFKINENLNLQLKVVQDSNETTLERLRNLKMENINLKNEINTYK